MSLNSIENRSDSFTKDRQLEPESNDFSDPYIAAEMIETQQELETLEDVGFQDYPGLLPE
ncbi:MAG: hypothetical protein DRQ43_00460 [Gammaproteobacteria bacterium]|nr:MAG: hypothetical protein DRQ43_00460 [Gammaproteobacteria bacterium]